MPLRPDGTRMPIDPTPPLKLVKLVILTGPYPAGSGMWLSPRVTVWVIAAAKVRHGAGRAQSLPSLLFAEMNERLSGARTSCGAKARIIIAIHMTPDFMTTPALG
jgi:hypothetical protein